MVELIYWTAVTEGSFMGFQLKIILRKGAARKITYKHK